MNEPPLKVDRASWAGARIICEQVSPESPVIFDLILELHHSCEGDWRQLLNSETAAHSEDEQNLDRFLVYAALFLFNNGNFYGYGDRKFVPGVSSEFITSLARNASLKAQDLLERCIEPLMSTQPSLLGFPGKYNQSGYYPGSVEITQEEVKQIDRVLESRNIGMENTRIVKMQSDDSPSVKFEVLQASSTVREPELIGNLEDGSPLLLRKGDYSHHLSLISDWLSKAKDFAQNDKQREFLGAYIEYFTSGDIQHFKQAQTLWIQDTSPVVENVIGFVEQYRDPAGSRAEFEGIVALADKEATKKLSKMVESSKEFIAELPWVSYFGDEEGLGPLESARFKAPDFTAIHGKLRSRSLISTFPDVKKHWRIARALYSWVSTSLTYASNYSTEKKLLTIASTMISGIRTDSRTS
jgi:dipeptidyl-peptidase-3